MTRVTIKAMREPATLIGGHLTFVRANGTSTVFEVTETQDFGSSLLAAQWCRKRLEDGWAVMDVTFTARHARQAERFVRAPWGLSRLPCLPRCGDHCPTPGRAARVRRLTRRPPRAVL